MKKALKALLITSILFTMSVIIGVSSRNPEEAHGQTGLSQPSCTASTTRVTIGDDISTQLVASTSNRAWMRISVGNNATNTVALAFNDITASMTGDVQYLNQAITNGASTTPFMDMGLNTDFPYTGAVKAITNFSTTTVLVTQCTYQ